MTKRKNINQQQQQQQQQQSQGKQKAIIATLLPAAAAAQTQTPMAMAMGMGMAAAAAATGGGTSTSTSTSLIENDVKVYSASDANQMMAAAVVGVTATTAAAAAVAAAAAPAPQKFVNSNNAVSAALTALNGNFQNNMEIISNNKSNCAAGQQLAAADSGMTQSDDITTITTLPSLQTQIHANANENQIYNSNSVNNEEATSAAAVASTSTSIPNSNSTSIPGSMILKTISQDSAIYAIQHEGKRSERGLFMVEQAQAIYYNFVCLEATDERNYVTMDDDYVSCKSIIGNTLDDDNNKNNQSRPIDVNGNALNANGTRPNNNNKNNTTSSSNNNNSNNSNNNSKQLERELDENYSKTIMKSSSQSSQLQRSTNAINTTTTTNTVGTVTTTATIFANNANNAATKMTTYNNNNNNNSTAIANISSSSSSTTATALSSSCSLAGTGNGTGTVGTGTVGTAAAAAAAAAVLATAAATTVNKNKKSKKKSQQERNITTVEAAMIEGHCGQKTIEELIKYIDGAVDGADSTKSSNKTGDACNKRKDKQHRKDKQEKQHHHHHQKKSNSLEELRSCEKMEVHYLKRGAATTENSGAALRPKQQIINKTINNNTDTYKTLKNNNNNNKNNANAYANVKDKQQADINSKAAANIIEINKKEEPPTNVNSFAALTVNQLTATKTNTNTNTNTTNIEPEPKPKLKPEPKPHYVDDETGINIALQESSQFLLVTSKKGKGRKKNYIVPDNNNSAQAQQQQRPIQQQYATSSKQQQQQQQHPCSVKRQTTNSKLDKSNTSRRKSCLSMPASERSESSDLESVHSLPVQTVKKGNSVNKQRQSKNSERKTVAIKQKNALADAGKSSVSYAQIARNIANINKQQNKQKQAPMPMPVPAPVPVTVPMPVPVHVPMPVSVPVPTFAPTPTPAPAFASQMFKDARGGPLVVIQKPMHTESNNERINCNKPVLDHEQYPALYKIKRPSVTTTATSTATTTVSVGTDDVLSLEELAAAFKKPTKVTIATQTVNVELEFRVNLTMLPKCSIDKLPPLILLNDYQPTPIEVGLTFGSLNADQKRMIDAGNVTEQFEKCNNDVVVDDDDDEKIQSATVNEQQQPNDYTAERIERTHAATGLRTAKNERCVHIRGHNDLNTSNTQQQQRCRANQLLANKAGSSRDQFEIELLDEARGYTPAVVDAAAAASHCCQQYTEQQQQQQSVRPMYGHQENKEKTTRKRNVQIVAPSTSNTSDNTPKRIIDPEARAANHVKLVNYVQGAWEEVMKNKDDYIWLGKPKNLDK